MGSVHDVEDGQIEPFDDPLVWVEPIEPIGSRAPTVMLEEY